MRLLGVFCTTLLLVLAPATSKATTTFSVEADSNKGVPFSFQADLTINADILTIVLTNNSTSLVPASSTLNPDDLLTSFYFDIFDGIARPTLTYTGATGNVCLGDKNLADDCDVTNDEMAGGSSESDLRATAVDDDGWQFKSGLTFMPGTDLLTFGIGTAGNNSLAPSGFDGNIVNGLDFGIYAGDISTQNLDGQYLILTTASYTFSGLSGFSEADIADEVLFGLGTKPDSTAFVPEPSTGLLLGLGLMALGRFRRRRFASV